MANMAEQYLNGAEGLESDNDSLSVEYQWRKCSHYGNCDCAVGEGTMNILVQRFPDGSIYADYNGEHAFPDEGDALLKLAELAEIEEIEDPAIDDRDYERERYL